MALKVIALLKLHLGVLIATVSLPKPWKVQTLKVCTLLERYWMLPVGLVAITYNGLGLQVGAPDSLYESNFIQITLLKSMNLQVRRKPWFMAYLDVTIDFRRAI